MKPAGANERKDCMARGPPRAAARLCAAGLLRRRLPLLLAQTAGPVSPAGQGAPAAKRAAAARRRTVPHRLRQKKPSSRPAAATGGARPSFISQSSKLFLNRQFEEAMQGL